MFRMILNATALALATCAAIGSASAATFAFTATRANTNILNPPGTGRCAPLNTVNIAPGRLSSTGLSNFGSFASTQSHCIPGAPSAANPVQPLTDGIFTYDFGGGNTFSGIYSGSAIFNAGLITGIENLTVQSGTGFFLDATGFIASVGSLNFVPNPTGPGFLGVFSGKLEGTLNLPAVPEPTTWGMMILGFGIVGTALRLRQSRQQHLLVA